MDVDADPNGSTSAKRPASAPSADQPAAKKPAVAGQSLVKTDSDDGKPTRLPPENLLKLPRCRDGNRSPVWEVFRVYENPKDGKEWAVSITPTCFTSLEHSGSNGSLVRHIDSCPACQAFYFLKKHSSWNEDSKVSDSDSDTKPSLPLGHGSAEANSIYYYLFQGKGAASSRAGDQTQQGLGKVGGYFRHSDEHS